MSEYPALPKMSDVSKWLRSLTKMSDHEGFAQVAHFWAKNERFARETDERIPSPGHRELSYNVIG